MRRLLTISLVLAPGLLIGCAKPTGPSTSGTLAELHRVEADVQEATVEHGLEQAMLGYREFLEDTPETAMTPEAMRRLADLQLEKQFGIHTGDGKPRELAAPESAQTPIATADTANPVDSADASDPWGETDLEFELRTTAECSLPMNDASDDLSHGVSGTDADPAGPLEAIALYDRLLTEYPAYEHSDQVLYQKARAYDELGRTEDAVATMEQLVLANPHSEHYDEVQFRRAEYFFTRRHYRDAEDAYAAIINLGEGSDYYELALYKLGWTLYKIELYEDALHRYVGLLDYRVSIGYDFDQTHAEEDERRVADTFRVISLSFSNLGGPEAVAEYFSEFGNRSYEDRVYNNLGEHYLGKLRYDDAAKTYRAFVALYPSHRAAPQFSMRVVDTFTKGGFPILVLDAKRDFAERYGLQAEYWRHFPPEERPEVLTYLKANLQDLATHYHAQYQGAEDEETTLASYREARQWYGDYLSSFPTDADAPQINYRLADLVLEHGDFGQAATQYERTAYDYPPHTQSAAAGYAAIYAYREQLSSMDESARGDVLRSTVASSLRFADTFPDHEHAAVVLGAAADDMYAMQDYAPAVEAARRIIDDYPEAEPAIRRSAWIVVAHGSFDLAEYAQAEHAYVQVLQVTPEDDEAHPALVDNLAASIYQQGELANDAGDHRTAADHYLRIRTAAPTSAIRPTAEYDAGVALMALESWAEAAAVLEEFREAHPEHELQSESTRLIANAYRENGQLSRAADEFDRIATETEDPTVRRDALLVAGDLYEQSAVSDRALDAHTRYVEEFPQPVETALITRSKIADIHKSAHDEPLYHQQLAEILRIDAAAGPERTGRTRTIAARAALVLAELTYQEFAAVKLLQPFEASLEDKQRRMDLTIETMGRLVEYAIADVTAAATYYMAETYLDFSRALMESERPTDLEPAELAEYELVLEEEAFPFEEKAIDVHEKNLEMLHAGAFNAWTEKSLGKLAEMVPGRYAKNEMSGGFVAAIDTYVYLSPECRNAGPSPADEPTRTTRLGPIAASERVVDHANPR